MLDFSNIYDTVDVRHSDAMVPRYEQTEGV